MLFLWGPIGHVWSGRISKCTWKEFENVKNVFYEVPSCQVTYANLRYMLLNLETELLLIKTMTWKGSWSICLGFSLRLWTLLRFFCKPNISRLEKDVEAHISHVQTHMLHQTTKPYYSLNARTTLANICWSTSLWSPYAPLLPHSLLCEMYIVA